MRSGVWHELPPDCPLAPTSPQESLNTSQFVRLTPTLVYPANASCTAPCACRQGGALLGLDDAGSRVDDGRWRVAHHHLAQHSVVRRGRDAPAGRQVGRRSRARAPRSPLLPGSV